MYINLPPNVQTAIDAPKKLTTWLFALYHNGPSGYVAMVYASTRAITYGGKTYNPIIVPETFSGVKMPRARVEHGIIPPITTTFEFIPDSFIHEERGFIDRSAKITLLVSTDNGVTHTVVRQWQMTTRACYQSRPGKLRFECEDFLHGYLTGEYPKTALITDLDPTAAVDAKECVPVVFGDVYPALPYIIYNNDRHYVMGESSSYTITKVRSPLEWRGTSEWLASTYTMSTTTATINNTDYTLLQPIIADSNGDGTADSSGHWRSGDAFLPMPCRFVNNATAVITNPADIISTVLQQMGVPASMIDTGTGSTFEAFASWCNYNSIVFSASFHRRRPCAQVLADLLMQSHATIDVTDKVEIRFVSSDTPAEQLTVLDNARLLRKVSGESTVAARPIRLETRYDSGQVVYREPDSPEGITRQLSLIDFDTGMPGNTDPTPIAMTMVTDAQLAMNMAHLVSNLKNDISRGVQAELKMTCLYLQAGDGVRIGSDEDCIIDELVVDPAGKLRCRAIKYSRLYDVSTVNYAPPPIMPSEPVVAGEILPLAEAIGVVSSGFTGVLSTDDNTVQKVVEKLDVAQGGYIADPAEADQGLTGNGKTIKALIDAIGASDAGITLPAGLYTYSTLSSIPANITLLPEPGALIYLGAQLTISCDIVFGNRRLFSNISNLVVAENCKVKAFLGEWLGIIADSVVDYVGSGWTFTVGTDQSAIINTALQLIDRHALILPHGGIYIENPLKITGSNNIQGAPGLNASHIVFNGDLTSNAVENDPAVFEVSQCRLKGIRIHDARHYFGKVPTAGWGIFLDMAVNGIFYEDLFVSHPSARFPSGSIFVGSDSNGRAGDNIVINKCWVTPGTDANKTAIGIGNFNNVCAIDNIYCNGGGAAVKRLNGNKLAGTIRLGTIKQEASDDYDMIVLHAQEQVTASNIYRRGADGSTACVINPVSTRGSYHSIHHVKSDGTGNNPYTMCLLFTSDTGQLFFDNCPVPKRNLLGQRGKGLSVALSTLMNGRLSVAARCAGVIEDCLKESVEYSKQRETFGKPLAKQQLVQRHISKMSTLLRASKLITYDAAVAKMRAEEEGSRALRDEADKLIAQAKYFATNAAFDVADRAVQVFGANGYSFENRVARHLCDTRVTRIYEGANEILEQKIAISILGSEYSAFR